MSSDDETEVNFRRTSNREAGRKRRVVFDLSDEEDEYEDAVDLASPGLPKAQSLVASNDQLKDNKLKLDMDGPKEDALKLKKENSTTNELYQEDISSPDTGRKPAVSTVEKVQSSEINSNVKTADDAPTSSKRKKMLKTRIDERGREGNKADLLPLYLIGCIEYGNFAYFCISCLHCSWLWENFSSFFY